MYADSNGRGVAGGLSIFTSLGQSKGKRKQIMLDQQSWEQCQRTVLFNCDECQPYIEQCLDDVKQKYRRRPIRELENIRNKIFPTWFKQRVNERVDKYWRSFKNRLKQEYYVKKIGTPARWVCRDTDVDARQWRELVKHWDKEKTTTTAKKNADNRKTLENHLTVVRRDFEVLRSQIEERNIRIDAANYEDAKRKGKLQEERAKAEAKRAALEPQSRTSNEAAARELASESALNLDQQRRQRKLKQLHEETQALRLSSKENLGKYEIQIGKLIAKITGANVTTKADELFKIFNDPQCPQCISSAAFAKKVVANCNRPDNRPFAQAYIIVLVTSKFPQVMDPILAELHKACIYTVPKHGEGKLESDDDDNLEQFERFMKLYGALVQTEIDRVENAHGLKEGWAWLARFVKAPLPNFANKYTAAALIVFLKMAGFSLYKKYKIQLRKLLNTVSDYFLKALQEQGDSELNPYIAEIKSYIVDEKFLCEPKGRHLEKSLLSNICVPAA